MGEGRKRRQSDKNICSIRLLSPSFSSTLLSSLLPYLPPPSFPSLLPLSTLLSPPKKPSPRGKGDYYRLGHADDSHHRLPKRVMGPLAIKKVVDIACGSLHCICCTSDGLVFTWGDNDEGQIGNDTTSPVRGPQVSVCVCVCVCVGGGGGGGGERWKLGDGREDSREGMAVESRCLCGLKDFSLPLSLPLPLPLPFSLFHSPPSLPPSLSPPLLPPFLQLIPMPDDVHIDHVSCGSAHSICWSSIRRKVVCKLPEKVPMEFNHLQNIPSPVLRNRLILLHHFSTLFCKSLSLFSLQSKHSDASAVVSSSEGTLEGFDHLRGILVSSAKVCV